MANQGRFCDYVHRNRKQYVRDAKLDIDAEPPHLYQTFAFCSSFHKRNRILIAHEYFFFLLPTPYLLLPATIPVSHHSSDASGLFCTFTALHHENVLPFPAVFTYCR